MKSFSQGEIENRRTEIYVTIHSRKRERALEGRVGPHQNCAGPRGRRQRLGLGMAEVDDASADPAVAAIAIREFPRRGRGVVATAPTAAGTTLVRALPFAVVPNDDALLSRCCVCLSAARRAVPCAKCGCAVLCQRCGSSAHARLIHSDECSSLAALFRSSDRPRSTRSLRLLIRMLCARWRAECAGPHEQYVTADGIWWGSGNVAADELEDIWALCEPPEDAPTAQDELQSCAGSSVPPLLWSALGEMAKQARYFLPAHMRVSLDVAADLMGRACSNSLTLYADLSGGSAQDSAGVVQAEAGAALGVPAEVGVGVSASVAMFNHDCEPNAEWALDADGCIVVRAVRDVRAGDEMCISYVDPRMPAPARQSRLLEAFFFTCTCRACRVGSARWSCALCGEISNGPLQDVCQCGARRSAFAAPLARSERRGRAAPRTAGKTVKRARRD